MSSNVQHSDGPAVTARPVLQLADVGLRFGRLEVLRDIGFDVQRGQTVAIIGESGCGKTVLLKIIIGLLRPTAGAVTFDGLTLSELSEKELTRQRIRFGFLFQGAALFDSLTVRDNVAFGCREHRSAGSGEIDDLVAERLREVGLRPEMQHKYPAELSGGERKRVGLARALAMDPEVLLYDEPTTGLDPIMSDVINELILQTRARNPVTSILVTHDMRTARKVADRILMLYPLARLQPGEPQILFAGTPDEIEQAPDPRVCQFVRGEAGERLRQIAEENNNTKG